MAHKRPSQPTGSYRTARDAEEAARKLNYSTKIVQPTKPGQGYALQRV